MFLICFLLTLTACFSSPSSGRVTLVSGVVSLSGPIDNTMAEAFLELDLSNVKRVTISSSGGDSVASRLISEAIMRKGLDVEAVGVCASSCASEIFVAGRRRFVSTKTLLVFHHSQSSLLALYAALPEEFHDVTPTEVMKRNASWESRLYEAVGANLDIALLGNEIRGLVCVHRFQREDGSFGIQPVFRAAGYAPTKQVLESYGIEVQDDNLPRDAGELRDAYQFQMGSLRGPYIVLLEGALANKSAMEAPRRGLRACEDRELSQIK